MVSVIYDANLQYISLSAIYFSDKIEYTHISKWNIRISTFSFIPTYILVILLCSLWTFDKFNSPSWLYCMGKLQEIFL